MMLAQGLAITGELGHFEELFNEVVYPTWLLGRGRRRLRQVRQFPIALSRAVRGPRRQPLLVTSAN